MPPSLTSSDRELLSEFARNGRTIVKTLTGIRANTREVSAEDFSSYEAAQGPVHVQRLIEGADIRAHVIASNVISVHVSSSDVDYRTGRHNVTYKQWELPDEIDSALVKVTKKLGLVMAGWDFKLDPDGSYWCLEANPMPGYRHYDYPVDGAISRALISLLKGESKGAMEQDQLVMRTENSTATEQALIANDEIR